MKQEFKSKCLVIIGFVFCQNLIPAYAQQDYKLKEIFENYFPFGAAVNYDQVSSKSEKETSVIISQFNAITSENCLKWAVVHPEPNVYNFEQGDKFVEFGEKNDMSVIGHILVDRVMVPGWVFRDPNGNNITRDILLARMREHIMTVVGRYKGRINCWQVVNEAIEPDGTMVKTKWYEIIGEHINGRTDYPLLFDREWKPKKAYFAIIGTVQKN